MSLLRPLIRLFAAVLLCLAGNANALEGAAQAEEVNASAVVFGSGLAYSGGPDVTHATHSLVPEASPVAARDTTFTTQADVQPSGFLHHITQSPRAPPAHC